MRTALDGDFTPKQIGAALGPVLQPPAVAGAGLPLAALHAGLWRLKEVEESAVAAAAAATAPETHPQVTAQDLRLMRAFETAPLWKPPVHEATRGLTPANAYAWAALAARWAHLAQPGVDMRLLNTACKLLGAVWAHTHPSPHALPPGATLFERVRDAAHLVEEATQALAQRLSVTIPARRTGPPTPVAHVSSAQRPGTDSTLTVVVLAGAGSSSADRFTAMAHEASLPLTAVYRYGPPAVEDAATSGSNYANAWYPSGPASPTVYSSSVPVPEFFARTWGEVAQELRAARPDLVILLGMPIVPPAILGQARLGVLNAHNGSLPTYRGMDAVGWALINDAPIHCTVHLARPAVDAGEVLASQHVPLAPATSLKSRVKACQLDLLLTTAATIAQTGHLPQTTPQPSQGAVTYYRLHPHLKRVLDTAFTPTAPVLDPAQKG